MKNVLLPLHLPLEMAPHTPSLLVNSNKDFSCCTERRKTNGEERSSAKTQYRKFETNIPRNGIAGPQSQFPHSCLCERFIYSHDRSAYSAAVKDVDRFWEYIKRSQTHECGNWDRAIPFLEIHNTYMGFSLQ
jgi:hypothetical protein